MRSSFLFHDALQRMLVLSGEIHDLAYFRLCDLICKHPTFSYAVLVHVQHDAGRRFAILLEKTLQNMNDELHWSVIVIQ
ncbi:hypothetical protein AGR1B_Cc80163 [Agrobacterium fabacearum S56]|nr:hypothetical protein AGR1B_Cc80163 [Agrobacterium fabacearum S56]